MRVFGYIRVSTDEQSDGTSLADQQRKIGSIATYRGHSDPIMISDVISGSVGLPDRPNGGRMWAELVKGDIVICSKLDRMFRSAEDALTTSRLLQERGVQLIITDMGVDPITENGISKLFFTMLAAVAEFERWRIKERANDGRAGKRKNGGHIGGDAPYGWRVEGSGKAASLIEIESEQSTIGAVKGLKAQGLSLRKVSDELAKGGRLNRLGKPFTAVQLERILKHDTKREARP